MVGSRFILIATLVAITTASPVTLEDDTLLEVPGIQQVLSTEVKENELTKILSDIIGLDVVKFADQAKLTVTEVLDTVKTTNERFQEIVKEASPEFYIEFQSVLLSSIGRLASLAQRVSATYENSPIAKIAEQVQLFVGKLHNLPKEDVSKEKVEAIIEEFLSATFTSTIRQELSMSKTILEVYFIFDDAKSSITEILVKEKPEVIDNIKVLISDVETSVRQSIRNILQLLRPLVIPKE